MRKKIYNLSIALLLGCSACNDWLTVQPATSILAEDLYTTNDGIKQALNGTYLNMREYYIIRPVIWEEEAWLNR